MTILKLFDAEGNETPVPIAPDGPLEHICEIGGQFDECSVYVEFHHKDLDHAEISSGLGLVPTNAWNAGERHPIGNGRSERTRIDDYGKWVLKLEVGEERVSDYLIRFFGSCSASPDIWWALNNRWGGRIALVGYAKNWNREFSLSREAISLLAERGLELNIDAYFEGSDCDAEA